MANEELGPIQSVNKQDEPLLKEIQKRYKYCLDYWKDIRDEAKIDMRYVAGDPWEEDDKKQRKDSGRPCISFDEINQYLNQSINNARQTRRGIKIDPKGSGANDQTAEFLEGRVRAIEYDSKAQRNAYIPAFESAVERSYGFFRIGREYDGPDSFEQDIRINGILNPDSVLFDPDCKKADWSDAEYVFVTDICKTENFEMEWPKAVKKSFSSEDQKTAPDFIRENHIVVCEYWKVEKKQRTLLLVDSPEGPVPVYEDELPKDKKPTTLQQRKCIEKKVVQYTTNGVEILETKPQPGTIIPIVAVLGKELYIDYGTGPERALFSMTRLARDPQMAYAYLISQETEEFGMAPRSPAVGYKGQFESAKEQWELVNKVPYAYLEVDPIVDAATGQLLPLPTRPQFQPNIVAYETAKESVRRAIQASMGIMPLPTAAQRQTEKSGVALEKIQTQEQIGSFHFTDNFDRALELAGKIIMEWIPVVDGGGNKQVSTRDKEGEHQMVIVNPDKGEQLNGPDVQPLKTIDLTDAAHVITIDVGPSYASEREAADDFLDKLISNLQTLPIPPVQQAKLLSLAIKARDLGQYGSQMAEIIDPPQPAPPDVAQLQAELQQANQLLQRQHEIIQTEQIKQQTELQKTAMVEKNKVDLAIVDRQTKILIAQIETKAQDVQARHEETTEVWSGLHQAAHETALQADQQQHQQDLAQQQAQQAQQSQASDQQFQAQQAAAQPQGA